MTNRPLLLILMISIAARLGTLIAMPDLSFGDSDVYIQDGRALLSGRLAPNHIYTPLYSILSYLTGGGLGTKLVDIGVSVATVWVLYQLAKEVFHRESVALLAALIAAIYPHFMFYSISRLSETLFIFLMCSAFLALYRARFGWGSALLVLSILTRPSVDLIAPFLIIAFAFIVHRQSMGSSVRHLLRYALIYVTLMSPWWMHNYIKYDAFVRLSLGDGHVLYSGNNPLNKSGGGVANSTARDDMDTSVFNAISDPIEKNDAKKSAAYQYISENPGRFIELAGIKFVRFWRLWPYAPEYQQLHIVVVSLLSYGVVLVFAVLFILQNFTMQWRNIAPMLLFIVYLTAIHMVTIGSIRYRLPLEPFLIIFAAFPFVECLRKTQVLRNCVDRFDAKRASNSGL